MNALTQDLQDGTWIPGPLERTLAGRLLTACAGDGQLTRERVRATLEDGSIAITYAGGGRLAWLLAQLMDEAKEPVAVDLHASAAALSLLNQVAQPDDAADSGH